MRIDPDKCTSCLECIDYCTMKCIQEGDDGVFIDPDECVECSVCLKADICPVDAIAHEDIVDADPPLRRMIHYTDTCIFCGMCEDACINDHQGIVLGSDWELSYFDRKKSFETIEKELQLCEVCGVVIGTKDHLVLLAEKLGEMAYSNPTIYLARLESLGVADPNLVPVLRDQGRSDRVKILCARYFKNAMCREFLSPDYPQERSSCRPSVPFLLRTPATLR